MRLVDNFLLLVSRLMFGDTAQFGINRPQRGPLELKSMTGKTPVLDIGTLAKIKTGHIKVLIFIIIVCLISLISPVWRDIMERLIIIKHG